MTVVGYARRTGEYDGKKYDNVNIYCTKPGDPDKLEVGLVTEVVKVKFDLFPSIIQVGSDIEVFYDRFGRVTDIRIV